MVFFTSLIIGGLIGYLIGSLIDKYVIRERLQNDDAFYGMVTKIQPNTVTIREIDEDGHIVKNVKIQSDDGVSDDLYEGEIIYAYE